MSIKDMGMLSSRKQNSVWEEPLINLTPLIDVVFVILIMFIVMAPLLDIDQIELASALPSSKKDSPQVQNSPITIRVSENNTITFNSKEISLVQLPQMLKKAKQKHPQARPQLFHDKRAQFGTYQAIKNAVESVGYEQMDVILNPS